jgi:F-type H+-transporting ATPase subunit beta
MAVDTGKVVQVLGNVVDVEFTPETLPHINDALRVGVNEVSLSNGASAATKSAVNLGGTAMAAREITLEVQDELGDNQVRCLALGSQRRRPDHGSRGRRHTGAPFQRAG